MTRGRRVVGAALVGLACVATQARAQQRDTLVGRDDRGFTFFAEGPYRAGVPRPDSLLGVPIGERNWQFHEQERALLAIAQAAPERVRVEEIGRTAEGRPMRIFLVSSPRNIARLDAIRADLARLADPRGATDAELAAVAARTPAVIWIHESVHGNESPGFDAAPATLYELVASEHATTTAALDNALVVLNPSTNPDGHERFAVWHKSVAVGDAERGALEHDEPWSIQGRFNHYRFDMNRDLIAGTQLEVRALQGAMLRWWPMVSIDQHGHTSTYFFPPAARPVHQLLGSTASKWMEVIGQGNAAAFDRHGWMYYSRDQFDLYYPGYFDTWPSLLGGTGMTYETDGGGWRGLKWKREDGTILTHRDGIVKHHVAALATIRTTAARAAERVRDWLAFRQEAIADGRRGPMRAVVLVPGRDSARTTDLVATLVRQGIEVRRVLNPSFARAHPYGEGNVGARRVDGVAYLVDLAQPQGRLARAILEPNPTLDPVFAKTQQDKWKRNQRRGKSEDGEGYEFYDITAWSLPFAFGVEAFWLEDAPAAGGSVVSLDEANVRPDGRVVALAPVGGVAGGARATSAYLVSSERLDVMKYAIRLAKAGVTAMVATEPIDAGGRTWPKGTIVVRVARNDSTVHRAVAEAALGAGVQAVAVNSAFTGGGGQFGIGSGVVVPFVAPKVAMLADEGISQTSFGAAWWSFDRRYGLDFTATTFDGLGRVLPTVNVLVIPDAYAGALSQRLGKSGAERLKTWMQNGGVLVTFGGATAWASQAELTTAKAKEADEKGESGKGDKPAADSAKGKARTTPAADSADAATVAMGPSPSPSATKDQPQYVPGLLADVVLDRTHWLATGVESPRLTVLYEGDLVLQPSKEGSNVAVFAPSGTLVRAGFTFVDNTERLLRGSTFLVSERQGRGSFVGFNADPLFRGWWRANDRLVFNAIVLGPSFR
ncbi:MAG: hypothetical protein MUF21_07880 [Gemmatimonadaceae bacterium]|nr:hypothetical protein [Gemmatimonadaceae bacterium]